MLAMSTYFYIYSVVVTTLQEWHNDPGGGKTITMRHTKSSNISTKPPTLTFLPLKNYNNNMRKKQTVQWLAFSSPSNKVTGWNLSYDRAICMQSSPCVRAGFLP